MDKFGTHIQNLIDEFEKFPGIGPKTAEKFVFYLLNCPEEELGKLGTSIAKLKQNTSICPMCFNFSETSPCPICRDPNRDRSILCVVCRPQDLAVIESTGEFRGLYHILGGSINAIKGIAPDRLKTRELAERLKKGNAVKEVIIATNYDLEGETTAMYLAKLLAESRVKISRLARGLPMGSDLEYADEITLSSALKERKELG